MNLRKRSQIAWCTWCDAPGHFASNCKVAPDFPKAISSSPLEHPSGNGAYTGPAKVRVIPRGVSGAELARADGKEVVLTAAQLSPARGRQKQMLFGRERTGLDATRAAGRDLSGDDVPRIEDHVMAKASGRKRPVKMQTRFDTKRAKRLARYAAGAREVKATRMAAEAQAEPGESQGGIGDEQGDGGRVSFRIRIEGVEVECDTAGEVRELLGMKPLLPALPNPTTPRNVGVRGVVGKGGTARKCKKCGQPGHRSDSKECPRNQKASA